ncbi:peroxidase-related enzyme [Actinopolyspora mortivallis]|uniref:Carboxymuconolactone decarboxylase n=1 Tax=Actinopolyspora mortivallis TaxID=33906 RepID=A0A2T0GT38_ACTMO|nr:peroxidase-related enzyme [Actinopolyspora mortivallis]PRW62282.1 carboxymuconolactone decarboxylase [Actinopolyspora mortivallis]
MPHIDTQNEQPGILGLISYRPRTGRALTELADALLRDEQGLSRGERELIAAAVSSGNGCTFCAASHGAFAAHQIPGGNEAVEAACANPHQAALPARTRALLNLAEDVRKGGREVTEQRVAEAREAGADDVDIHDTVLIAAAFCMFNRYVDGLNANLPDDERFYEELARAITEHGYTAAVSNEPPG